MCMSCVYVSGSNPVGVPPRGGDGTCIYCVGAWSVASPVEPGNWFAARVGAVSHPLGVGLITIYGCFAAFSPRASLSSATSAFGACDVVVGQSH